MTTPPESAAHPRFAEALRELGLGELVAQAGGTLVDVREHTT
ncbi:hypothetical protein [Streptomyces sp. NTH33]|nr:hypothetical protein [Streptomyces sp. NTH33]